MSPEPDETQVMPVIGGRTPILERLLHEVEGDLSRLTHHRRYHQDDSPASPVIAAMEAPPVTSIVDTIKTDLHETATNMHGWVDDFEQKIPALFGDFAKVEQSPIVQEVIKLGETVLPPEVEASVVGLIQMGGKLVAGAASAVDTPPAAEVPAAPAEPVAAVPVAG